MLNWARRYGPTCIALVCGIVATWALISFAGCVGNYYQAQHEPSDKNHAIFYICFAHGPVGAVGRLGHFINHHFEAFLATISVAATVAIAWFTLTLKQSTDNLWRAAEKQRRDARLALKVQIAGMKASIATADRSAKAAELSAKATIGVELPRFTIDGPHIHIVKGDHRARIPMVNHGRTPAEITASCLIVREGFNLPSVPRYPFALVQSAGLSTVVDKGGRYIVEQITPISDDVWQLVLTSKEGLWAYGYIDYLDFMKAEHREGFCVRFEPKPLELHPLGTPRSGRWVQGEMPEYTYSRYKTPADSVRDEAPY